MKKRDSLSLGVLLVNTYIWIQHTIKRKSKRKSAQILAEYQNHYLLSSTPQSHFYLRILCRTQAGHRQSAWSLPHLGLRTNPNLWSRKSTWNANSKKVRQSKYTGDEKTKGKILLTVLEHLELIFVMEISELEHNQPGVSSQLWTSWVNQWTI